MVNYRKELIKEYFNLLRRYKNRIILSVIIISISTICIVYAPIVVGNIINDLNNTKPIFNKIILLLILYLAGYLLKLPSNFIMAQIGEEEVYSLRLRIYDKLTHVNLDKIYSNSSGNIMARVNNDIMNIRSFIIASLTEILSEILVIIIVLIIITIIHWQLSLIYIVSMSLYLIFLHITHKKSRMKYLNHQKELGKLTGYIGDNIVNHILIQSYNAEEYVEEKFNKNSKKVGENYRLSRIIMGLNKPINNFFIELTVITVYTMGAFLLIDGTIKLGILLTVILYGKIITKPFKKLSTAVITQETLFASYKRVIEVLNWEDEKTIGIKEIDKTNLKGDIEFKNINYKNILTNFNFKANAGDIITITGASGTGKTTLMNLLIGLYPPDSGEIYIDNTNIYDIKAKNYKKLITYVFEEKWIFEDTIANNISYGQEEYNLDNIKKVCKSIHYDKIIEKLPEKYNTIISDDKNNISESEKELINIARALLEDSKILILDNITIDILDLIKNKTVFIITENKEIIKKSDKIIKL